MGTSWPPSKTRFAILDALIMGEFVQTKNTRTKNPASLALRMYSTLSTAERGEGFCWLRRSFRFRWDPQSQSIPVFCLFQPLVVPVLLLVHFSDFLEIAFNGFGILFLGFLRHFPHDIRQHLVGGFFHRGQAVSVDFLL